MNWRENIYEGNNSIGATKNPVMENPDDIDEEFATKANAIISNAVELVRNLIPSHQSAIAIVVEKDWSSVRKYFSLSPKYAEYKDYAEPAKGLGIHDYILHVNRPLRLKQNELEQHPEWRSFGNQNQTHPPMQGWLATPIVDANGKNWGLIQLSDKLEGEFDETDERLLIDFTKLVSDSLELAWEIRNIRKKPSLLKF